MEDILLEGRNRQDPLQTSEKKTWEVRLCCLVASLLGSYHSHAGHDHPGPLLDAILGHWAIYTHPKVQPVALQL